MRRAQFTARIKISGLKTERKTQVKTGSLPELRKQSWESRDVRPAEFTRPNLLHLEHGSKNMVLEVIQSMDSGCSGLDNSVCSLLN